MQMSTRVGVGLLLGSVAVAMLTATAGRAWAEPRAVPEGQKPADTRLGELRTLNGYFPFHEVASAEQWQQRAAELRRRVRVANGLWPELPRTELNAVVHGKVEREDYTVERVYFEALPGHFVTGSLYRPKGEVPTGGRPAVLSPHGHWPGGRFHDHGEQRVRHEIAQGAERFEQSGRFPLQARAVQLARMGAVVLLYDMIGYADSVQMEHRPGVRESMNRSEGFGFFSPQAELRQINMKGLQTWNSIRALDFLTSLDDVDADRLGVTGASGGATQTFILCAIDERPAVSVPAVMVSTAMQGGCPCENASHLRVDGGNIDLAALTAPRPQALIHADDWTIEMEEKGMPELRELYAMLGHEDHVDGGDFTHFRHNFNAVSRMFMYDWMNRHLSLGEQTPVIERDFEPLAEDEATVWTDDHPAPSGEQVGDAHERDLVAWWDQQQREQIAALTPADGESLQAYREVVGGAVRTIIGRGIDDGGAVEFELVEKIEHEQHVVMSGPVTHRPREDGQEQLPTLFVYPRDDQWNGEVVIALHERGKAGLLEDDGELSVATAALVDAGFAVAGIDLLMQGEFTEDGEPIERTRLNHYGDGGEPWQQYAGYTFGYNPSLFAQRVHDVLTMIRLSYATPYDTQRVHLLAAGETVGPIAAAAGALADDRLHTAAIDTAGFRFAELDRFDHPMFTPGMVRYGDVPGLLALNAPRPLWVAGEAGDVAEAAYGAAGADALTVAEADDPLHAAVRWLIER